MKRSIASLLLALCLCLGLTACGNQQSQDEAASDPAVSENTDAQLSGKVTVYMPSPSGLADKLAEAFTAKTGVEVEQFQGTTGEILARLEAEQANPVADVVILASWSDDLSMKADGQLESYIDEAFFLGGVSKRDVLSAFGAHIFFDDKHVHADPASEVVPSAVVPYREGDNPEK